MVQILQVVENLDDPLRSGERQEVVDYEVLSRAHGDARSMQFGELRG